MPNTKTSPDNGFALADLTRITQDGKTYDRKSYTHNIGATFNGHDAASSGEAELWVELNDQLQERTVLEDGKDYVDPSTTKSWLKIREVWSISGEKVYTKSVNLKNGIAAPAKITKILENFNLTGSTPSASNEKNGQKRNRRRLQGYDLRAYLYGCQRQV